MKKCAFCGSVNELTGEHVIPNGLIKLFPEQDITFMEKTKYKDNEGLTINDVCKECNNIKLGILDEYGVSLIKKYFYKSYKEDDSLTFEYDYDLLGRWLLKIAYNLERVKKQQSIILNSIKYILDGVKNSKPMFSIYAGLHVDMTLLGVENEGDYYIPLQIIKKPHLLPNGMILEYMNDRKTEDWNVLKLNSADCWYVFRFASAIFFLVLWRSNASLTEIAQDEYLFLTQFPLKGLLDSGEPTTLRRVTDNFTCRNVAVLDGDKGIKLTDYFIKNVLQGRSVSSAREDLKDYLTKERMKKGRLLVELTEFPNNKKLLREFEKLLKGEDKE